MEIQEPQASIIASGMERFASDELEKLSDLAKYRESVGLVKYLKKTSKKNRGIMHLSTVSHLLKNILYAGYIEKQSVTKDRKTGRVICERDIPRTKGKHEGIISLATYERIQEKLNGKHQPATHGISLLHPDFPLR